MTTSRNCARRWPAILLSMLLFGTGCRSYHIETSIENHSGAAIRLLEVDYPSASFGTDGLAAGAVFHYRIQVQGSGPVKIQYTVGDDHQVRITGPILSERQQGNLEIVLLPGDKVEFQPQLTGGS